MAAPTNQRLSGVLAGFLVALGCLWVRCVWLQVIQARRLSRLADAQHQVARSLVAQRGAIVDRAGRVLAMSVRAPSVFANPRQMVARERTAWQLANMLDRDADLLRRRLMQDKGFVWLSRHADPALTPALHPFLRHGIGILEEPQRVYPHGKLASHVVGYVDIDQKGLEGLELAFNGVLRGRRGWQSTLRDAKGDLLIGPWTVEVDPRDGYELVLTIDSVVQEIAEEALAWGVTKFHAKGGSLIVMDPHSGAVLAMANQPTMDLNQPGRAPVGARRNRAITDLFEPGSIFKVVSAAALLEEQAVRLDERIFCERGAYPTVARHVLHDHRPHGWLTFHDVIMYSSNIGTAKAARRLPPETLYRYIRAFGFGRKTGIELPGEVSGLVPAPARWSKLSPFIIPIGQEVAVTPIQLAVMLSVVANGGWKVHPYVVERIQTPEGELIRRYEARPRERILRPETAQALQTILRSVVESGTGQPAKSQGLTVAGKTGTAQKLEPDGRYSHSRFVASFVGYGPVPDLTPHDVATGDPSSLGTRGAALRRSRGAWDDPHIAVVVTLDEPRPLYFGGVVAGPVFRRLVERLASSWDLTQPSAIHLASRN